MDIERMEGVEELGRGRELKKEGLGEKMEGREV